MKPSARSQGVDGEAADLVAGELGEPDRAVGAFGDAVGLRVGARQLELEDVAVGRDLADPVAEQLREPEVAVRAGRDLPGRTLEGRDRELSNRAGRRVDAADLV